MSDNIYRNAITQPSDRIIAALDDMTWPQAKTIMGEVSDHTGMSKANSLAQAWGWLHAAGTITHLGMHAMADTKFHDIPNTVRLQVKAVTECGARFITVHASGSEAMLKAAVVGREQGREQINQNLPTFVKNSRGELGGILGITVLTSIDTEECESIYGDEPKRKVVQFAHMALDSGIDGIVCSGKELQAIRAIHALDNLITVVPGITPEWATKPGDQKRVVTPRQAFLEGADFQVVGRAITQPPEGISRAEAAERIVAELVEAA